RDRVERPEDQGQRRRVGSVADQAGDERKQPDDAEDEESGEEPERGPPGLEQRFRLPPRRLGFDVYRRGHCTIPIESNMASTAAASCLTLPLGPMARATTPVPLLENATSKPSALTVVKLLHTPVNPRLVVNVVALLNTAPGLDF